MTFPVVRLAANSVNNACLTDNPAEATAILYTFLRSVPSRTEIEVAMDVFERQLRSQAQGHKVRTSAAFRSLQRLEQAVFDGLLRHPPLVHPRQCRESLEWVERLQRGHGAVDSSVTVSEDTPVKEGVLPPKESAILSAGMHRQYRDPYETYIDQVENSKTVASRAPYTREVDSPTSSSEYDDEEADTPSGSSESTVAGEPSHQSVEISAITGPASFLTEAPHAHPYPSEGLALHPLLTHLTQQVLRGGSPSPGDLQEVRFRNGVMGKLEQVGSDVQEARKETEVELERYGVEGDKWSAGYARRKAAHAFLEDLEDRVRAVESLFRLQCNEQDTLQQSHVFLSLECTTMRIILKDVRTAVKEAAASVASDTEEQLLAELWEVLQPTKMEHSTA